MSSSWLLVGMLWVALNRLPSMPIVCESPTCALMPLQTKLCAKTLPRAPFHSAKYGQDQRYCERNVFMHLVLCRFRRLPLKDAASIHSTGSVLPNMHPVAETPQQGAILEPSIFTILQKWDKWRRCLPKSKKSHSPQCKILPGKH